VVDGGRRGATIRALFVALIVMVGLTGCAELWAVHSYGSLNPLVVPSQVNAYGRDYHQSQFKPSTRAEVLAAYPDGIDILEAAIGAWPFVAPWDRSITGYSTPTVVWLHVGPDAYRAYELSGGP
jgi:hypothetical protein